MSDMEPQVGHFCADLRFGLPVPPSHSSRRGASLRGAGR